MYNFARIVFDVETSRNTVIAVRTSTPNFVRKGEGALQLIILMAWVRS